MLGQLPAECLGRNEYALGFEGCGKNTSTVRDGYDRTKRVTRRIDQVCKGLRNVQGRSSPGWNWPPSRED
eukprot:CAMPEP_0117657730 /NCGR_PEP_ID=MMETSP0804-20121206/5485_1 /TAXON_ID=1074897 /ORGANISM="Tetraselmis astigmatica, Strain CCMP880" /LENGTH=69 /DNA_ID=CAMNT_0005464201 /DNA_START=446 /DNA_END=655 /DNA_ORIENTATION=+